MSDSSSEEFSNRDFSDDESAAIDANELSAEELPPVEPPSAGFILRLFVVPALIVMAIAGVWALFGKLAAGNQDWQSLVVELRSGNKHRRDRAAYGLAQMLIADSARGESGQQLSINPELAAELSGVLDRSLDKTSLSEEDLIQQAYLALALGLFDVYPKVVPVLKKAMQSGRDREVRKNAIAAIALMADRSVRLETGWNSSEVVVDLIDVSFDADPLLRQVSAYALGLIDTPQSRDRLAIMLDDSDVMTSLNAAIALARLKSTQGYAVFKKVLSEAMEKVDPDLMPGSTKEERRNAAGVRRHEQFTIRRNILEAVGELAAVWTEGQRLELVPLIEPIASDHHDAKIQIEAQQTLNALREQGE